MTVDLNWKNQTVTIHNPTHDSYIRARPSNIKDHIEIQAGLLLITKQTVHITAIDACELAGALFKLAVDIGAGNQPTAKFETPWEQMEDEINGDQQQGS